MPRRSVNLAAPCAIIAFLAASCGNSDDRAATVPAPSTSASTAAGQPAAASSKLLALADMPTGFSQTQPSPDSGTSRLSGCPNLDNAKHQGPTAEADFNAGDLGPFVTETIATHVSEADAKAAVAEAKKAINSCRAFSDGSAHFKLASLSFPKLGDDTVALRLTATTSGVTLTGDLVEIRSGELVALITNLGLKADSGLTETVAHKAVGKLAS